MARFEGRREGLREALAAGFASAALVLIVFALDPGGISFSAREALFDRYIAWFPRTGPDAQVVAVDIDRASLERMGPWPWRRAQIAGLVAQVAGKHPRAIALDVLLEGPDRNGPRAVIGRIARDEQRADLTETAQSFADDDAAFAASIDKGVPVILGLGIDTRPSPETFPPLVLATAQDTPVDLAPVRIGGLQGPAAQLVDAAAGLGILSLDTDRDGRLRRAPLLFDVGARGAGRIHAGLALETIRVAEGVGTVIIAANSRKFEIGKVTVGIEPDALMRLYPRHASYWENRIVPAWRLSESDPKLIDENTIVVIGSSAPEAGAYFPGAVMGAVSTLRVQTEAVDQLRSGVALRRVFLAPASEWTAGLFAGLLAVAAAALLPPMFAAAAVAAIVSACFAAGLLLFFNSMLADIIPAVLASIFGAGAASMTIHNRIRANRTLVEARFARYLAPAVVEILARNPQMLRIEAERREVTALFTDLEGFTSFGERTPPAMLIATLNDYFELIAKIAVSHGGMVDKIVGDAVHVFFNMPLDQPDHAERAMRCARAIHEATEDYRKQERQTSLGFGRTRIGVDTGYATVGDVGGRDKLDYTAHGEAVNRAARLQSLARDIPSGVLIGIGTVQRLAARDGLKNAGKVTPRGLSEEQDVFTLA